MNVEVQTDGAIVLPPQLLRPDGIHAGDQFRIERLAAGRYLVVKQPSLSMLKDNKDFVDWLLACPEKGWFEPMPRSESTDTIRSPFE